MAQNAGSSRLGGDGNRWINVGGESSTADLQVGLRDKELGKERGSCCSCRRLQHGPSGGD